MNIDKDIIGIIDAIKRDILSTRNRIFENANRELISMYYRIGQNISENSKYGNQFVETLSSALKLDFPNAKGYSVRNLFRMKKFYEEYKEFPILPPAVAELPCIGLLLCKKKDRLSVEWALKAVNVPVGVASYEVSHRLPTEEKSTDLSQ